MSSTFTIALTQTQPNTSTGENLNRVLSLVDAVGRGSADLILIPENALCIGSNDIMRSAALRLDGYEISQVCAAARRVQTPVILGGVKCIGEDGIIRNSAIVISHTGEVAGIYNKVHRFNANIDGQVFNASGVEAAGEELCILEIKGVKFGLSICFDLRFPGLYRTLAKHGAEVLLIPAAFTQKTGEAHWETLLRARAIENSAYVIASATIRGPHSSEDGFETYGHALAVGPWGEVIENLREASEAYKLIAIDLDKVKAVRSRIPVLQSDRPDVYAQVPVKIKI